MSYTLQFINNNDIYIFAYLIKYPYILINSVQINVYIIIIIAMCKR